jgi:hypothetical protein
MKSFILTIAILFAPLGCMNSTQDRPPENYGWQPPPEPEERRHVYGDDAPEYPTVREAIKNTP